MIAARAGMPPSRLSEYILQQREIPPHHLISLCQVLNCEPEDIVGLVEENPLVIYTTD